MTEQATDTLIAPAVEEVGKTIVALVKRRLNYLCCLNRNINNFNEAAKGLQNTRDDLERKVDRERENGRQVSNQVETWLEDIDKIQSEETKIKKHISNAKGNCFSIVSRYSLSKKAKETAEAIEQLQERRQELVDIAQDAPPPSKQPIPQENTFEFGSRKQIEDDIVNAFKGDNIVVGIAGMGGLGKTIMAKKIKQRMMDEKLVDEVVMVVVSQPVDILKIQHEMGEQLGLKEIESQHTIYARAQKLHMRLKGVKPILIVLDDVWKELDLDELGIPRKTDSGSCFVLLTSRNKDELAKMNAKVCGIPLVTNEEALSFFKEKSKISKEDKNLMPLAKQIVNKCQGLPLALVTLGSTLK